MKKSAPELRVVLAVNDLAGKCPLWHPIEKTLYWVAARGCVLRRLEVDGRITSWTMPSNIGSFVFREAGGVIADLKTGFVEVDLTDGTVIPILDPVSDLPENRHNDGRCDRRGATGLARATPATRTPVVRFSGWIRIELFAGWTADSLCLMAWRSRIFSRADRGSRPRRRVHAPIYGRSCGEIPKN
jgi:hypothetical protein